MTASPLDPDRIERSLASVTSQQFRIQTVGETGSTNDDAFDAAFRKHARSGLVIIADQQTVGRGRRGDAWIAPAGTSILMSILVRPEWDVRPALWSRMPHLAGVTLARAIENAVPELRDRAQVKWPNDIYLGDRKVAGILVESQVGSAERNPAIVVGVGLNVSTTVEQFPEELQKTATSLWENAGRPEEMADRNAIATSILIEWDRLFPSYLDDPDFEEVLTEMHRRSHLIGKRIELTYAAKKEHGIVTGFGNEGELILIPNGADKPRKFLNADLIRIVRDTV